MRAESCPGVWPEPAAEAELVQIPKETDILELVEIIVTDCEFIVKNQ